MSRTETLADRIRTGGRVSAGEALHLYHHAPLPLLGELADAIRARKIDLGEEWTAMTGLPFVYACWTGWPGAVGPHDVTLLQRARDAGTAQSDAVAAAYYPDDTPRQALARRYLRDNIRYVLGHDEIEGLKTFYRYTGELGLVTFDGTLRFYDVEN